MLVSKSYLHQQVEDQDEHQQVGEQKDDSALVFVVGVFNECDEALSSLPAVIVFGDCEAHDYSDYQAAQVTQVVDVSFG